MRILVIGGTRFIGPYVIRELASAGHQVAVYHRGSNEADLPSSVTQFHSPKAAMPVREFTPETIAFRPEVVLHMVPMGEADTKAALDAFRNIAKRMVAIKKNSVVQDAQAAITGVNPAPHLIPNVADALRGKPMKDDAEHNATVVGELAAKVAKPLTTSALTPDYRREMIRVFAKRAVLAAVKNN